MDEVATSRTRNQPASSGAPFALIQPTERFLRSVISTHSMHAAARRGRCRADIYVFRGSRIQSRGRPKHELAEIHNPASNVPAHQVRVHAFEVRGRERAPRQNNFTESRSKALNLVLDPFEHVYLRSIRNMTVCPRRVFPLGSARWIEKTGLSQKNEGTIGVLSASHRLLRCRNLFECPAQVYGRRPQALGSLPRNRRAQGVVHFERARSIAESLQLVHVALREPLRANFEKLARGHITKDHLIICECCQRLHSTRSPNRASEGCQIRAQRIGNGLSSTARNRPSDRMRGNRHQHAKCSTQHFIQCKK